MNDELLIDPRAQRFRSGRDSILEVVIGRYITSIREVIGQADKSANVVVGISVQVSTTPSGQRLLRANEDPKDGNNDRSRPSKGDLCLTE